ncbi:MAG: hemerythrin domain-containing protein [Bacteroidetes bacterium]|nr:hemerythrin domain-containing protein [Bacteroidota bacterium]
MKRHPGLIPFSWEHHHGLVFARRLKNGAENGMNTEVLNKYLTRFWDNSLATHFELEESFLLSQVSGQSIPFRDQLIQEHRQLDRLAAIARMAGLDSEGLTGFSGLLTRHIRFEESHLFPWVEKTTGNDRLMDIGAYLSAFRKLTGPGWPEGSRKG